MGVSDLIEVPCGTRSTGEQTSGGDSGRARQEQESGVVDGRGQAEPSSSTKHSSDGGNGDDCTRDRVRCYLIHDQGSICPDWVRGDRMEV